MQKEQWKEKNNRITHTCEGYVVRSMGVQVCEYRGEIENWENSKQAKHNVQPKINTYELKV